MNEKGKILAIVVMTIAAVGISVWQGYSFFTSQTLQYVGKPMGHFSKGHTGKMAMMAARKAPPDNPTK
jgi:hypothetical protein